MEKKVVPVFGEEIFHITGQKRCPSFFMAKEGDIFTVAAVNDALDPLLAFINEHLSNLRCDAKVRSEIRLAVEEIFVNICSYAYKTGAEDSRIACQVQEGKTYVQIQFSDTGVPFDPLSRAAADVTSRQFLEREGGFGIYLVMKTMDEVNYEYKNGMNILRVKRFLSK